MATALSPDQIGDIVTATLEKTIKVSWVDISLDLQDYLFSSAFMRGRTNMMGGPKLIWQVQVTNTGSARTSGLYDVDNMNVKDLLVRAEVDWAKVTANYTYDIDEEAFNGGAPQIVNHISVRAHSMYNDYFELMEELMWQNPGASASPQEPFGIPHWVVKSTTDAFGFNGGNPSSGAGSTDGPGNIDSDTYGNWSNGTGNFTVLSESDGLALLAEAFVKTQFRAPDSFRELAGGRPNWGLFTTYGVIDELQRHLKSSNDNIGTDLGRYRGTVLFRGVPIEWVPAFDETGGPSAVTDDNIYGLNFKSFRWVFQSGKDRRLSKPIQRGDAHTVFQVHMDSWGNFQCLDRRKNFVINRN